MSFLMMFRSGLGGQAAILFSARSALVLILNWVQLLHMTDECVSKDNNNNNNFDHSHHHDEDVVFCVLMSIHKLVGIKIILDHSLSTPTEEPMGSTSVTKPKYASST